MSYASAYSNRPPSKKGAAMTIGVHALVITGVLMLPGIDLPDRLPTILTATNVPIEKPPEAIPDPVEPEVRLPREPKDRMPVPPAHDLPQIPDIPITDFSDFDAGTHLGGMGNGIDIPIDTADIPSTPDPVITDPQLNNQFSRQFQPPYPSARLRMEEEGLVTVRVLVGTNGRAKKIELISTPHEDFWTVTKGHALRKWRFKPATKDGSPFESWITLKVRFEINA